jgi:organic radical activating enzyme
MTQYNANMQDLLTRPLIITYVTMACNLRCNYCTVKNLLLKRPTDKLLEDKTLREIIERVPNIHLYLIGGEPLLYPELPKFVAYVARFGHRVSFDTNLTIGTQVLKRILDQLDPSWVGYFDISHHLEQRVPLKSMAEQVAMLRERGFAHFVKYIAVPSHFSEIERAMSFFEDQSSGVVLTILYSANWNGNSYPRDYTHDQINWLLRNMTLGCHTQQVFGGIKSAGIPCRAGQDAIMWENSDPNDFLIIPCCHGRAFPVDLNDTFFVNGKRGTKPCHVGECMAYPHFAYGINGVASEIGRYETVLTGGAPRLGIDRSVSYLEDLHNREYEFVYEQNYLDWRGRA